MNIDFELYRIFNEVANIGNITKASERLHISQPAVSKAIKSLESQLGGELFVRTKKGVVLTENGKELHNYIRTAIEYIRNAENKFSDMISLNSGTIKIGISRTLVKEYLLPYLEKFHNSFPNIKIEIVTNMASELIPKLREGLIDMVIANLPLKQSSDIVISNLKVVQDVFVVNKKNDKISRKIKIEELNDLPLILQTKGTNTRDYLDNFVNQYGVYLEPEMTLASYGLVEDLAKIGFGVGYVVKEFVEEEIEKGELDIITTIPKIPPRNIGLILKKDAIPSFASKKLIDLLYNN